MPASVIMRGHATKSPQQALQMMFIEMFTPVLIVMASDSDTMPESSSWSAMPPSNPSAAPAMAVTTVMPMAIIESWTPRRCRSLIQYPPMMSMTRPAAEPSMLTQ